MSGLIDSIKKERNEAMKARAEVRLKTLRFILSDLSYLAMDKRQDLSDQDVVAQLRKMVKQREESIKMYEEGKRAELADIERNEIVIIKEFLPAAMEETELLALLKPIVEANPGVPAPRLMKDGMAAVSGRADGNAVRTALEKLAQES